jgi:hypothetical protein
MTSYEDAEIFDEAVRAAVGQRRTPDGFSLVSLVVLIDSDTISRHENNRLRRIPGLM